MNTAWHKSSYSVNGSNCVEVRERADSADVRDTQHRDGATLTIPAFEWRAFLTDIDDL